jgi:hypothetical protein
VGVSPDGQVWRSPDATGRWQQLGRLGGQPEAMLVHDQRLYAAVAGQGIFSSADRGQSWQLRYRQSQRMG